MVGVVVVDLRPVICPLVLQCGGLRRGRSPGPRDTASPGRPSTYAAEAAASALRMLCLPGIVQLHMGIDLPVDHHVKHRAAVEEGHVVRHAVRRPILYGEGEHRVLQSLSQSPVAPASSALEMM